MREFTCLAIFIILSAIIAVALIVAGFLCQYKKESAAKNTVYECGIQPLTDSDIKFDVKYFNYAILFLVFDIETIFLYPFAANINRLGTYAIAEAFVFVFILLTGLYTVIRKNMLRWV